MCFITFSQMVNSLPASGWLGFGLCDDVSAGLTALMEQSEIAKECVCVCFQVGLANSSQGGIAVSLV